jgi:hypothetical protein
MYWHSATDDADNKIARRLNQSEKDYERQRSRNSNVEKSADFTVPAYGFVMALYLDSLGQSNQAVPAKRRRWLSDNSTENEESFRG